MPPVPASQIFVGLLRYIDRSATIGRSALTDPADLGRRQARIRGVHRNRDARVAGDDHLLPIGAPAWRRNVTVAFAGWLPGLVSR